MIAVYQAAAQMTYVGAFTENMHGDNLATLKVNGSTVAFTRQTIRGVKYALFQVAPGTYQGTYTPRGARSQS
jgi:hypothetical protein